MSSEQSRLIARVRDGNLIAFRKIMELHQRDVFNLAYDMTGNRQDAEDLSQEVFIKAFYAMQHFRGDAKIGSWLYRITVNTCIDKARKKKEEIYDHSEEFNDTNSVPPKYWPVSYGDNPEKQAEKSMMQRHIQNALQKLSPGERTVFILRHYHDLPLGEIAKILDISPGTVKSQIHRAFKKLQTQLSFYRNDFGREVQK